MPRPERPLDPSSGPVPAFAAELRELRRRAGSPKYLQMARLTGKSRTALAEAAGGDHLATWETVEAYVTACRGDIACWRQRWEQVDDQVRSRRAAQQAAPAPVQPAPAPVPVQPPAAPLQPATPALVQPQAPAPVQQAAAPVWPVPQPVVRLVEPVERTRATERRLTILVGIAVVLVILSTSAAAVTLLASTGDDGQVSAGAAPATIVRETGPQSVEIRSIDSAPVYLSSRPEAGCAQLGCAIPGKELSDGQFWVAHCYRGGEMMTAANPDHDLIDSHVPNPQNFRSNGWYGSVLPSGQLAYLSEVHVEPEYRGGLGLPDCVRIEPLTAR